MAAADVANDHTSDKFSAPDADITMKSSDGVLFKLHRKNLEMYSNAFPGIDIPTYDEIVTLSESSTVLEFLFQFMYKQRQPQLDGLPFDTLAGLAEAVEKYEVFPATEACKARMQIAMFDHSLEVLSYASRHVYYELCNMAAPGTLSFTPKEASQVLDLLTFKAWVLYKEEVNPEGHSLPGTYGHQNNDGRDCNSWPYYKQAIKVRLLSERRCKDLAMIDEVFSFQRNYYLPGCRKCQDNAGKWHNAIRAASIGFTNFLK